MQQGHVSVRSYQENITLSVHNNSMSTTEFSGLMDLDCYNSTAVSGEVPISSSDTIGGFIEERLGVEGARFISPLDLARIGASVWPGTKWNCMLNCLKRISQNITDCLKENFPVLRLPIARSLQTIMR